MLFRSREHLGRQLPAGSSNLPGDSASRAIAPLFGLAPDGVWRAVRVATSAVGSYPVVSRPSAPLAGHAPFHHRLIRCPSRYESETLRPRGRAVGRRPLADYSLCHFPSPHGVRSLTGILLCGARTFLCASELHSDCPASFTMYSTRCIACIRNIELPAGASRRENHRPASCCGLTERKIHNSRPQQKRGAHRPSIFFPYPGIIFCR